MSRYNDTYRRGEFTHRVLDNGAHTFAELIPNENNRSVRQDGFVKKICDFKRNINFKRENSKIKNEMYFFFFYNKMSETNPIVTRHDNSSAHECDRKIRNKSYFPF